MSDEKKPTRVLLIGTPGQQLLSVVSQITTLSPDVLIDAAMDPAKQEDAMMQMSENIRKESGR